MTNALHVVSEPRRQQVLRLVWDTERAAGDIAAAIPDITFGAVSQHLKILRDAGLVQVRRDGQHRFYRADRAALRPLEAYLTALWGDRLSALVARAEAAQSAEPKAAAPHGTTAANKGTPS